MKKIISILFFLLSTSFYAQTHMLEVSKIHVMDISMALKDSFIRIEHDKDLFTLKMDGYEPVYFKIINIYVSEKDKYSTLSLEGRDNQPFTVIIYFDNREKNLQINYPEAVVYYTVTKN